MRFNLVHDKLFNMSLIVGCALIIFLKTNGKSKGKPANCNVKYAEILLLCVAKFPLNKNRII